VEGTIIRTDAPATPGKITGIAGRSDFTVFTIHQVGMNEEVGFFAHVLEQFRSLHISVEHVPGGIDTLSVIVPSKEIDERVIDQLTRGINPYSAQQITITTMRIALIAVVGRGMAGNPGSAAKIFTALAEAGIDVKLINQGALGTSIIVGVEVNSFEPAIRVLYKALVK
jgi:aspartate kinase